MKTLKQLYTTILLIVLAVASVLGFIAYKVHGSSVALAEAQQSRYESMLLADELRQTSDDLTRLARTYVVTGDPVWERQYFEVLDIRGGKTPRPPGYEGIYWDFRAAGITPPAKAGKSTTVSLTERMRQAGFTAQELGKLEEASNNSYDLVKTETIAMNMVKGLYEDASGEFTRKGEPNPELARQMLHNADYHRFKAKIMKPVDEFMDLLSERTHTTLIEAGEVSNFLENAVLAGSFLMIVTAFGALLYVQSWMKSRLGSEAHVLVSTMSRIADGDLSVKMTNESKDPNSMAGALNSMVERFADSVATVRRSAESVASASAQISSGNAELTSGTERQARALEETASSMEEVSTTIKLNSGSTSRANELAQNACDVALKGGEVVGEVVETMNGINAGSMEIANIINVINDIAFQTNLLALNAAVESARAGEQGRGFAVVAGEVRTLAQRSSDAADNIKALINNSVTRVEHGAQLADKAGHTMAEIAESIRQVTGIIGEISHASAEQTQGVLQIGSAVNEIDQNTQKYVELVSTSSKTSTSLERQARELMEAVAVFRLN